jgi:hypothetical protein
MRLNHTKTILLVISVLLATLACFWIPPTQMSNVALVFTPDQLPDAQVGVPYSAEIQVTKNMTPVGGAQVSDGKLPAGLTLEKVESKDTILISGTPTEAGTFTFTVAVWCYGTNVNGQMGQKKYTLIVK